MPRIAIKFTEAQAHYIGQLADAADLDDADIVRGLVELDMNKPVHLPSPDREFLYQLQKKIVQYLDGEPTNVTQPKKDRKNKVAGSVDRRESGRWRARAPKKNGKQRTIGMFDTDIEALDAVIANDGRP